MNMQVPDDLNENSPLETVDALIGKTREEIERLKAAGQTDEADKLWDAVLDPLRDIRLGVVLNDLQVTVVELNRLSALLETASRQVARDTDRMFMPRTSGDRARIENAHNVLNAELRVVRADDAEAGADAEHPAATGATQSPPDTKSGYNRAFKDLIIRDAWLPRANRLVDGVIEPSHANRYRAVELRTKVPWWFIGLLHSMEANFSFNHHLHNGDPLSGRTVHKPDGRPPIWNSRMSWEDSAVDALVEVKKLNKVTDWSVGNVLELTERWNGLGYRSRGIFSPFLWSGSEYYERGKFVADHEFDPEAVSAQVGTAVVLKRLQELGALPITASTGRIRTGASAMVGSISLAAIDTKLFKHADAELKLPRTLKKGMGGPGERAEMAVKRVQEWCRYHNFRTGTDGDFGDSTATAVRRFQNRNNLPETGDADDETWALLTRPLREALAPVSSGPELTSTALAVARQHMARNPIEIGGNNHGPWVRLYMAGEDGEKQKWCAGFVCFIVAQAARDLRIKLPFKRQVSVDALVKDAKDDGRFIPEALLADPKLRPSLITPGTLFVIRNPEDDKDWTHVGIVTQAGLDTFDTIEGNTNGANRDGANAKKSNRSYKNKDFLRLV